MRENPKPYPKNVEGDFYVEDGCCTGCMVYEHYAPNLVSFDESDRHCFIAKQPTDENELYQAVKIIWASETACVRYGGKNPRILKRLGEAGLADCCDRQHLIQEIKPLLRNHVTFECLERQTELEIANQFKQFLVEQNTQHVHHKISKITKDESGHTFSYSWHEENYYPVWFNRNESINAWHIFHSPDYEKTGSRGVSMQIDEWLRSNEKAFNIKWYGSKAWNDFLPEWRATPI
jgi:hypothetical protein